MPSRAIQCKQAPSIAILSRLIYPNFVTMMYGAFEPWWLAQIECPINCCTYWYAQCLLCGTEASNTAQCGLADHNVVESVNKLQILSFTFFTSCNNNK